MVTPRERRVTFATVVLLVAGVELDVAVAAALVFEQAAAEGAAEGQLVAVALLVPLEEAQAAERFLAELTGIGQAATTLIFTEIVVVAGRGLVLAGW